MSFQRVMETARRLNLPMVITDVAGREPMVVMPLAIYERLLETASTELKAPEPPVYPHQMEEKPVLLPETPPLEAVFTPAVPKLDVETILALEERFYLERSFSA